MQNSGETKRGLKKGDDCGKALLIWKGAFERDWNKKTFKMRCQSRKNQSPKQGKAEVKCTNPHASKKKDTGTNKT